MPTATARTPKAAPPGFTWRNGVKVRLAPPTKPAAPPAAAPVTEPKTEAAPAAKSPGRSRRGRRREPWAQHRPTSAPLNIGRFYFVWCPIEGTPRFRHETREGAKGQAKHLAAKFPGREFFVFEATQQGMPERVLLPALQPQPIPL